MYSKIPQRNGAPAAKVIFEGVDPGSSAEKLLTQKLGGQIGQFQLKARMHDDLSDQVSSGMQQALPDGGMISYTNNNGLEVIRVALATTDTDEIVEEPVEVEEKIPESPVTNKLAIDVLFKPAKLLVADISSYVDKPASPPAWPNVRSDWRDQTEWSLKFKPRNGATDATYFSYTNASFPDFYWVVDPPSISGSWLSQSFSFPDFPAGDYPLILVPYNSAGPPLSTVVWYAATNRGLVNGKVRMTVARGWKLPTTNEAEPHRSYEREQHYYLSTLTSVALVVMSTPEPPGEPEPTSTALAPSGDKNSGILQAIQSGSFATTARDLQIAEDTPMGFAGAGFLATVPAEDVGEDTEVQPIVIDVYMSSSNAVVQNSFPDAHEAVWDEDDPSYTYTTNGDVEYMIRARGLGAVETVTVGVTVTSDKKIIPWPPGEDDLPPPVAGSPLYEGSDRGIDWAFAATEDWVDTGQEPADPAAAGMGALLAESGALTADVTGPETLERRIPDTAEWTGELLDMTKVATITWTPAADGASTGSATIAAA